MTPTTIPKYLLRVTAWPRQIFCDQDLEPHISWFPFTDEEEADQFIRESERPGFGKTVTRVVYDKFMIGAIPRGTIEAEPITMLERARGYISDNGKSLIDIKLYGRWQDGPEVFWDSKENSFVIVKPPPELENDKRYVSDQGVMLVSINGIGEIRWSVGKSDCQWPENKEATDHFGLTWTN